jgi:hypothetical protein
MVRLINYYVFCILYLLLFKNGYYGMFNLSSLFMFLCFFYWIILFFYRFMLYKLGILLIYAKKNFSYKLLISMQGKSYISQSINIKLISILTNN